MLRNENYGFMEWFKVEAHPVLPLLWAGTPPTVPESSRPQCPTWPGTVDLFKICHNNFSPQDGNEVLMKKLHEM